MLTVTERAAQFLRESLSRKDEGAPEALRIIHADGGYQLTLDDPKEGDQIFEHEGQSYLVIDSEIDEALSEATIDVQESAQGASLTLTSAPSP